MLHNIVSSGRTPYARSKQHEQLICMYIMLCCEHPLTFIQRSRLKLLFRSTGEKSIKPRNHSTDTIYNSAVITIALKLIDGSSKLTGLCLR